MLDDEDMIEVEDFIDDVRIMKKRSFILNDFLKVCRQRLDYNVLAPYLQQCSRSMNMSSCASI